MKYVIFGAGRVGRNIAGYLGVLGHDVNLVTRTEAERNFEKCCSIIKDADVIAAAISDSGLRQWYTEWAPVIGDKPAIHFSGASVIDGMFGFHPLYSFPRHVVDEGIMAKISFACPPEGPGFSEIFPDAENPNFILADEDRAKYHALAVLSGNLTVHLWNETSSGFEDISGLPPPAIMGVYLQSLVDRFLETPADSLTGPVARRDAQTVSTNLQALENDVSLRAHYEMFLQTAWPNFPD